MGANMVRRLLKQSHQSAVFDRSPKTVLADALPRKAAGILLDTTETSSMFPPR
jgi:hypothetical protein